MHPQDVADLVSDEFERLREGIVHRPDLRADTPGLTREPLPLIRVAFSKVEHARLTATVKKGMFGPGGGELMDVVQGIDLSRKNERRLILQLGCDGYDGKPPTAELLADDGSPLPSDKWPTDPAGQGIVDGHRDYKRKFFCRRGLREFHSHPEHEDEPWDAFRETTLLHQVALDLLDDLQHRWIVSP